MDSERKPTDIIHLHRHAWALNDAGDDLVMRCTEVEITREELKLPRWQTKIAVGLYWFVWAEDHL